MKARILVDDPSNRFKKGDTGLIIENDSNKYAFKVQFDDILTVIFSDRFKITGPKVLYFYKDEIEVIE